MHEARSLFFFLFTFGRVFCYSGNLCFFSPEFVNCTRTRPHNKHFVATHTDAIDATERTDDIAKLECSNYWTRCSDARADVSLSLYFYHFYVNSIMFFVLLLKMVKHNQHRKTRRAPVKCERLLRPLFTHCFPYDRQTTSETVTWLRATQTMAHSTLVFAVARTQYVCWRARVTTTHTYICRTGTTATAQ